MARALVNKSKGKYSKGGVVKKLPKVTKGTPPASADGRALVNKMDKNKK